MLNKLQFTAGSGALLLLILFSVPSGTVPAVSEESGVSVQSVDESLAVLSRYVDEGRKTGRINVYQAEKLHFELGRVASLKRVLAGDDGLLSRQEVEHLQRRLGLVGNNIRLARQEVADANNTANNTSTGAIRERRERRLERYPLSYRTRPDR